MHDYKSQRQMCHCVRAFAIDTGSSGNQSLAAFSTAAALARFALVTTLAVGATLAAGSTVTSRVCNSQPNTFQ